MTAASEQVSPTPVMPVMPESVRSPKFQLRRLRVCATTRLPSCQMESHVTELGVNMADAENRPHPLKRSTHKWANSKLSEGSAPVPPPPSTARSQIF